MRYAALFLFVGGLSLGRATASRRFGNMIYFTAAESPIVRKRSKSSGNTSG